MTTFALATMTADSTDEFFSSFYRDPPYPSRGRTYSCTRERWRGKGRSPQSPLSHLNELISFNDTKQVTHQQLQQQLLKYYMIVCKDQAE